MKSGHVLILAAALVIGGMTTARGAAPGAGEVDANSPSAPVRRLFVEGRWREAVEALSKARQADPVDEDLQFMEAMVAMETGDYAGAIRLYSRLLEKYPDNAGLKNNLAWLRLKAEDPATRNLDLALREAQEAVMAAPSDYNIWNTLGEVYLVRGDPMRAMRYAVLARDMAAMAGEPDLRVYQDLVNRCEPGPAGTGK